MNQSQSPKEALKALVRGLAPDALGSRAILMDECMAAAIDQLGVPGLITVCDKCLRACCWKGMFMCDDAYGAGTTEKSREELIALGREHSDYWRDDDA